MTALIRNSINTFANLTSSASAAKSASGKESAAKWKSALAGAETPATKSAAKTTAKALVTTSTPPVTATAAKSTSTATKAKTAADAETTTTPTRNEFDIRQEYLANVRQLLTATGAGSYLTGSFSTIDGGDGAAFLPSRMVAAGITPSQAVLDDYTRVTGLDPNNVAVAPVLDLVSGKYTLSA